MHRPDSGPRVGRPLIAVLALGSFVTALNVTMLTPLLPAIGADFGVSDAATGQLATVTAASSGVTALVASPWMDRWPRRSWLRFEAALLLLGTLLSAVTPGFGWPVVARAVAGVGGAIIYANSLAAAAELFPDPGRRNRVIGFLGTALTLGAVLGLPVLAQVAEFAGWRGAVAALLPPIALVFVGTIWLPGGSSPSREPLWRGWWSGYRRVLARPETLWLLWALVVLMIVWFGWLIYFGAFAEDVFAIGPDRLSALLLAGGIAQVARSNLAPPLVRRFRPRVVAACAMLVVTFDLLGVGIVYDSAWSLFPFIAIAAAGCAVLFLCISILLLDAFPAARGAVMALQSAGLELGGAVGVAGFGLALALVGDYSVTYRLCGLVMPLVAIGLIGGARRSREVALSARSEPDAEPA